MKIGDKVRILSKNWGKSINESDLKVGDVRGIEHIYSDGCIAITNNVFKPIDFELVFDFKVGDKVRILGKTSWCNINETPFKIGDECIIDKLFWNDTIIEIKEFDFNLQDLELIKEEEVKVKYKKLRKINGVEIEKAQDGFEWSEFKEGFIEYLKEYGYKNEPDFDILMKWTDKRDNQFLIDKGFIEEIKEFEPFELKLNINSKEELYCLWHKLNLNPINIKNYTYCTKNIPETYSENDKLWRQVNEVYEQMKEEGKL